MASVCFDMLVGTSVSHLTLVSLILSIGLTVMLVPKFCPPSLKTQQGEVSCSELFLGYVENPDHRQLSCACVCVWFVCVCDRVLCSPFWFETCNVDRAGLIFTEFLMPLFLRCTKITGVPQCPPRLTGISYGSPDKLVLLYSLGTQKHSLQFKIRLCNRSTDLGSSSRS